MVDKESMPDIDLKIPDIALGKKIPYGVERYIEAEERAKRAERRNLLYFIGGLIGTLAGTVLGWALSRFF